MFSIFVHYEDNRKQTRLVRVVPPEGTENAMCGFNTISMFALIALICGLSIPKLPQWSFTTTK